MKKAVYFVLAMLFIGGVGYLYGGGIYEAVQNKVQKKDSLSVKKQKLIVSYITESIPDNPKKDKTTHKDLMKFYEKNNEKLTPEDARDIFKTILNKKSDDLSEFEKLDIYYEYALNSLSQYNSLECRKLNNKVYFGKKPSKLPDIEGVEKSQIIKPKSKNAKIYKKCEAIKSSVTDAVNYITDKTGDEEIYVGDKSLSAVNTLTMLAERMYDNKSFRENNQHITLKALVTSLDNHQRLLDNKDRISEKIDNFSVGEIIKLTKKDIKNMIPSDKSIQDVRNKLSS